MRSSNSAGLFVDMGTRSYFVGRSVIYEIKLGVISTSSSSQNCPLWYLLIIPFAASSFKLSKGIINKVFK